MPDSSIYPGVAAYVTTKQGKSMAELQRGKTAPDVELPTDDGGHLSLKDLAGKPVVFYFYPQDDTETCTAEAIEFSRLKPEFGKAGAAVFGISPDSLKKHGKFRAKYKLTVDLAADEERSAIEAYGCGRKSRCSAANTWALSGQRS